MEIEDSNSFLSTLRGQWKVQKSINLKNVDMSVRRLFEGGIALENRTILKVIPSLLNSNELRHLQISISLQFVGAFISSRHHLYIWLNHDSASFTFEGSQTIIFEPTGTRVVEVMLQCRNDIQIVETLPYDKSESLLFILQAHGKVAFNNFVLS